MQQFFVMLFTLLVTCVLLQGVTSATRWPCMTPSGEPGKCVTLVACPTLMKAFANPKNETLGELSSYVKCSTTLPHVVCCGLSSNFTALQRNESVPSKPLLQNLPFCGIQTRGSPGAPPRFPWLAEVTAYDEEDVANGTAGYGAGVLINCRYVLTYLPALVQYTNETIEYGVTIYLGDFERRGKNESTKNGIYEKYGVDVAITHPFYSYSVGLNTLTLLKLDRDVKYYTAFIRPICLPTPTVPRPNVGSTIYFYGREAWGATIKTDDAQMVSLQECRSFWKGHSNKPITEYNVCTDSGSLNYTQSPCAEPGAVAMFSHRSQWYLGSIVSWVIPTDLCGSNSRYVHIDVSKYLEWIQENSRII